MIDMRIEQYHITSDQRNFIVAIAKLLELSKSGTTVCRSNAGKVKTKDGRTIALFPKGWPDITGFRHSDGKMILIECKNARGQLREDQQQFEKFINQYPVLYGVARSVEDALAIVDKE